MTEDELLAPPFDEAHVVSGETIELTHEDHVPQGTASGDELPKRLMELALADLT